MAEKDQIQDKRNRNWLKRLKDSLGSNKRIQKIDRPFQSITELVLGQNGGSSSVFSQYNQFGISYGATPANRLMRYREYDIMEIQAPMIGNALDAWAAGATRKDPVSKRVLQITSSNEEIIEDLDELFFVTLEANTNLYTWTRLALKYGDWFLFLKINENKGIEEVFDSSVYEIDIQFKKDELTGKTRQVYVWSKNALISANSTYLNSNPAGGKKYEFYPDTKKEQTNFDTKEIANVEEFEQFETVHFTIPGEKIYRPFGKGVLETARYSWKQYWLMRDAVLIYRVVRAPSRLKFKIEVGNLEGKDMQNYLADQMAQLKRVPLLNAETGDINQQYHIMSHLEDYVLPRRNNYGSDIEELPGGQNTDAIQDVEMFRSELRSALKVPKAYLEYDESLSTARGLAMEDDRFSTNVERVQQIILKELYKIAIIHLSLKGYDEDDLENFELSLVSPSTQNEKDRLEILQQKIDIINNLKNIGIGDEEYWYKQILEMDATEISRIHSGQLIDARKTWKLNTIVAQGDVDNMFKTGIPNPGAEGGGKEMMSSLGGGGGMGGGSFGGDEGGLGGGSDIGGGELPTEGAFGSEGNANDLNLNQGIEGIGNENPIPVANQTGNEIGNQTPNNGIEQTGYDPLKLALSNDLITNRNQQEAFSIREQIRIRNQNNFQSMLENALKRKNKN